MNVGDPFEIQRSISWQKGDTSLTQHAANSSITDGRSINTCQTLVQTGTLRIRYDGGPTVQHPSSVGRSSWTLLQHNPDIALLSIGTVAVVFATQANHINCERKTPLQKEIQRSHWPQNSEWRWLQLQQMSLARMFVCESAFADMLGSRSNTCKTCEGFPGRNS